MEAIGLSEESFACDPKATFGSLPQRLGRPAGAAADGQAGQSWRSSRPRAEGSSEQKPGIVALDKILRPRETGEDWYRIARAIKTRCLDSPAERAGVPKVFPRI
jgi:hypothetical protein